MPVNPETARELGRLAEQATPGPWEVYAAHPECYVEANGDNIGSEFWPRDAAYIAAADPPTVLALLAELAGLRTALEEAQAVVIDWKVPALVRCERVTAIACRALAVSVTPPEGQP